MSTLRSVTHVSGERNNPRFVQFLKNNACAALAFFASAGLMLFVYYNWQMIPFGDKTILRSDLYHQYSPLFAELHERLAGGRSFLYSWNTGLGGNFLGSYFNYLSSPSGLLVLLFGHEKVPEAIGAMILLKCAFASGTFAYMLRKMFQKGDAANAAFGVLYSFCGWFLAYYWDVMWVDAMALLPLVALGIYYCVHKRKFMLYTVALAVTLLSNYYMGFMVCIFSVPFFLVQYFSVYEARALMPGAQLRRPFFLRYRLLHSGAAFALGSLLGAALAAFALLPLFFALKNSSATSGTFPDSFTANYFHVFDFFINHFADIKPTFRSSGEAVLPNVYSGVAVLLLTPLYMFIPSIKRREKVAHVLLLLFLCCSFYTNILNYVWHGFHFPNDLPYRFSFMYSFVLLLIAYKVFRRLREIPVRTIALVGGFLALFIALAEKLGSASIQDATTLPKGNTLALTLVFLIIYALLFAAIRKSTRTKSLILSSLMLCCVITEVCVADVKNFDITQPKAEYTAGTTDFQQLKRSLEDEDKSFYRMELTDYRTLMDPAWYDYRGISIFSSMAYEHTANLEYRLGLGGNFINSYSYSPNTPVYNAMHNLKYLVETMSLDSDGTFTGPRGSSYLPVLDNSDVYTRRDEFTRGRFTVFENRYSLPIGFWVNEDLRGWDTATGTDPFRVQEDFWSLSGAGKGVFNPLALRLSDEFYGESGFDAYTNEQYVGYSGKPADSEVSIPFYIDVKQTQNVYIMVDSSYNSDIRVDGHDGAVFHRNHDHKAVWDLGIVTPDKPLSLSITLSPADAPADGGFFAYVYGLNMETFLSGYNTLKDGALQLTYHSESTLQGTINAPHNGLFYTSIPYDESWQVHIDGERVPVKDYVALGDGAFLAVPLQAGEHTIALNYVPQGLFVGLLISGAALVLLVLILLLTYYTQKDAEGRPFGLCRAVPLSGACRRICSRRSSAPHSIRNVRI